MFGNRIVTRDCVIHCSYCPRAAISPARRLPRVTGLATTTVEEEGASTLALRQARPRIGLSSPYVVFCNWQANSFWIRSFGMQSTWIAWIPNTSESWKAGDDPTALDRFSPGNGRSDDSGKHQRRQYVQTGRQIRLIVRMIWLRIISSIMPKNQKKKIIKGSSKVRENFSYRSNTNKNWLGSKELKLWIKKNPNYF